MKDSSGVRRCFVFDGFCFVLWVARVSAEIVGCRVERLHYKLVDVYDDAGTLVELRLRFSDLFEVQAAMRGLFASALEQYEPHCSIRTYLGKALAVAARRRTLLVQIALWQAKNVKSQGTIILFVGHEIGLAAVSEYASRYGVSVVGVRKPWRVVEYVRRAVGHGGSMIILRAMLHYGSLLFTRLKWKFTGDPRNIPVAQNQMLVNQTTESMRPSLFDVKVAVQQTGSLNLSNPEQTSDLFFWQQSPLSGKDLLVLLNSSPTMTRRPIEEEQSLGAAGIARLGLSRHALITSSTPSYVHWSCANPSAIARPAVTLPARESRWLNRQITLYNAFRSYWTSLFLAYRVKVFCTWFRYDEQHCAITDALRDCGGVMTMYPRALVSYPSPLTTVAVDVCFSYSVLHADLERRSQSNIPYHVTVGFIGDHRFPLLQPEADRVRGMLRRNGASRILALFDEHSLDDARWSTGHEFMRVNYLFLLEKVLQEPWFGLVIKPKVPANLRRRLGDVACLLDNAISTGRCYVYEDGGYISAFPPAVAALAADVAVHAHLCAGTAGVEAALAGVPTLLVDREGWPTSPLYELGVGRVVFRDWDTLWKACCEHWSSSGGSPGFGDWGSVLDSIDPFRDGRAAARMGTYIKWLIDGFKHGLNRDTVMADAAERYCAIWGKDKVTDVTGVV
ncbi:MAG: hypothetical protein CMH81_00785 [Nitrospiraceae bacterium]|nr:hypothetical protein [Nitrospiraceae bacterium]